jgi:hypothetical protein
MAYLEDFVIWRIVYLFLAWILLKPWNKPMYTDLNVHCAP